MKFNNLAQALNLRLPLSRDSIELLKLKCDSVLPKSEIKNGLMF
jgi:hypothetical protein